MKDKFIKFMQGRYGVHFGVDELNKFLIFLFILSILIGIIFKIENYISPIRLLIAISVYFRLFSKNIDKRIEENKKYLDRLAPLRLFVIRTKRNLTDKNYKYIRCPICKKELRVPKKKGKIKVICSKCKNKFVVRT